MVRVTIVSEQLDFTKSPEERPETHKPALITSFPGPADKRYHAETLLAYLTNIERLATYIQSSEDWQLASVELLDNTRAALALVKCM